ncbi:phosphoglycolate phosphatase [Streptomyces sp. SAI-133]|nr:phosphoglycolate phosphatase [Streptomyces sp. SAI-133]
MLTACSATLVGPNTVRWTLPSPAVRASGRARCSRRQRACGQLRRRASETTATSTEPVIFRETAKLHGLTTDRADFERFARPLTAAHLERAAELRERGHALPGAAAALNGLTEVGVRQTVVSGNIRAVAELKLQVFGLDAPILWELGAYGEDHDVRADLVQLSLERAHTTADAAVLIGDTPADIEGAHTNSVRVIAVATGRSDQAALRDAGAEVVLPDLRDTDLLVKLVRHGG